ncbi:mucin-19 isoform X2 [Anopheles stephensi]|uniref:mucin-19 isoform X2 n=1 Tax=Anopheles stephensi TaxID=30069 RepID=UPI001658AFD0|nr:mucin-19 isoform X2 [Anopheles stephensi]
MEDELSDGEIVWVKVSNSWWPGEVMGESRLSEEFLSSLRKKPLAVVKFFQEDSYEYVKNPNFIFKYNCPRKNEFLRKGLEQYRAKMKHMEKFPADVMHAERVTGGDPDIVNSTDFQPQKKERYSGLFQEGRSPTTPKGGTKGLKEKSNTPSTKSHAMPVSFGSGRKTVHEVRILAQPSSVSTTDSEPGAAALPERRDGSLAAAAPSVSSSPGQVYHCYKCNNYSANRQNLIILHIKHCRMSCTVTGGGLSASSSTMPPMASARKVSREKVNESAEEEDLNLDIKTDHSRRSLPMSSKGKPFETTPISSVQLTVPFKDEPSSEKRTRGGGRKPIETQKQKKIARRRNKRDQSPDADALASAISFEAEDDQPSEDVGKQTGEHKEDGRYQGEDASVPTNRDEPPTYKQGPKNSTDVKLKNELLADWSEDEPEDDEGVTESGQAVAEKKAIEHVSLAEKKIPPPKDSSPVRTVVGKAGTTKRQHKESRQETASKQAQASKKAIKAEAKIDGSAMQGKDGLSDKVKEAEKDQESSPEDSATGAVTAAITVTASEPSSACAASGVTTTAPTAATTATTASPYATIKYRNIPKKQKREFIEVTNDDVSMVQEKYAVPSREGSTASSSSTTGSYEPCTGSAQSTTAPVPTVERPISAKQLILNRATRGSSKSLSGDENAMTVSVTAADDGGTTTASVATGTESSVSEEQKSQSDETKTKPLDPQGPQESSCFDFNDDEEERKVPQMSTVATKHSTSRLDRKHEQTSARIKPTPPVEAADAPQEEDRDVKLCQEIDSLLCEMDVPKLPEDLNDVMAAVSDKIDCNRTLPPKERGKRIFKTRNKTVAGAASSSSFHSNTDEGAAETEPKALSEPADTNDTEDRSDKQFSGAVETEEKPLAKDRNESKKQEDHQHPSVTSSAMTEELVAVEPMDVDQQQQQSMKKKRKSEEMLLPDSSGGNGEPTPPPLSSARRRGKFGGKHVAEGTEQKPSDSTGPSLDERESSSSSSRKSKRSRRELTSTTTPTTVISSESRDDAEDTYHSTSERVSGRKRETVAMVTEEASADGISAKNDDTSPPPPVKKQSIEIPAATPNATKPKREEIVLQSKKVLAAPPPSTSIDTTKPTATDLQAAEALINLPVVATTMASVSSSEEKQVPTTVSDAAEEAVAVVRQATAPSSGSSLAKSINPRKRHLQSMMLTTTEEPKPQAKKSSGSDSCVPSSVVASKADGAAAVVVPAKQDPPSIPEKSSDNDLSKSAEKEETNDELMENDKFDISNMPIVMDESELLVEDASSSSVSSAATIAVVKGVNGAGNAPGKVEATPIHALTTSGAPSRDKRQTTVASVKGGRASKEQIVITSKGTILTTSTANVTVASKFSTTAKPSVSVTSAITLATSCRVASSTPTLAPNGSPSLTPPQPPPPPSATVAVPAVTTPSVPPKIILTKKPLPNAATESVKSSKMQERRLSGDGGSSSVSSSSGSDAGSKKSHRVLRLTPQKLKEFSRLGYIEDRQGKGKMLTKSGMRQLYGKQAQLKQQQARNEHLTGKKKAVPLSTKIVTTTGVGIDGVGLVVGSDSTTSSSEVASSGSNVVIAAAADSSVQESSAMVERNSAASDPSAADDMEEEAEALLLEQQNNKVTTEAAPAPGTSGMVEGASPTSSGTTGGPVAEVILGSAAELTIVGGGGSMAEATSSSGGPAAPATGGSGVQESSQLVAVTAENFGGPPHLFYLCSVRDETFVRVNDELLYLDASNQLVALPEQQHPAAQQQQQQQQGQTPAQPVEDIIHQAEVILPTIGTNGAELPGDGSVDGGANLADGSGASVVSDGAQQSFLLNTQDGQHIILDQQSLMALAAGGDTSHIITADGQQIVLQEPAQEWLAALSAGQQQQLVTPEGTQIIVAHETAGGLIELQEHPVLLPSDIIPVNPNTTIETNAVLTKPPIMSTVEVPTKNGIEPAATEKRSAAVAQASPRMATGSTVAAAGAPPASASSGPSSVPCAIAPGQPGSNLDETLAAVIGHVPSNPHVPTSLELPITVTNPAIAKTSTAGSRMNAAAAAAALFPLTTTAAAVSSLAGDTISAVVLVSGGAEAPGTIDRVPPSTSPPLAIAPVQKVVEEGEALEGEVIVDGDDGKPCPLADEPYDEEDDIQIPNTPESQQSCERLDDEFSDDNDGRHHEEDGEQPNDTRNHLPVGEDESNSNCSEIIAIQPNVVVLDADLLLNSPPNDDGIDDEMERDSEDDSEEHDPQQLAALREQQHRQQQQHRARHVAAARSTNGEDPFTC